MLLFPNEVHDGREGQQYTNREEREGSGLPAVPKLEVEAAAPFF
jgi:hypothetical protein